MELMTIKHATKRTKKPRSLTVEEFRKFIQHLEEPFPTMALLCVCFGLRISEALALKWGDVDWLNSKLRVERGIVAQITDDVKTPESRRSLHVECALLDTLKLCKQTTQFSTAEDWLFASPAQLSVAGTSRSTVLQRTSSSGSPNRPPRPETRCQESCQTTIIVFLLVWSRFPADLVPRAPPTRPADLAFD